MAPRRAPSAPTVGGGVVTAARAVGMTDTERLAAIEALHVRGTNGRNTARARCTECGFRWPCLTVRIARGEATEMETPHA